MKDTCNLIELYSTGKISLDSLFVELESSCILDKNQIIEYCNRRISIIRSTLENFKISYLIIELFILASFYKFLTIFIQSKFIVDFNNFSIIWFFLLIYLVFVNTITPLIFETFIVNFFFKNRCSSLERLKNLKSLLSYYNNNICNTSCSNCLYYHGKSYQGDFLVCSIHPHGKENCPDFESK